MAELTSAAGLAAPEFEASGGEVLVRFWPTRYVPSTRVSHDLSPLQRDLLEALARLGSASLKQVRDQLTSEIPRGTVQDNLQMLKRLGLVETVGHALGARWMLQGVSVEEKRSEP